MKQPSKKYLRTWNAIKDEVFAVGLREYSLSDMARRAGVAVSTLTKWQSGQTLRPRLDTLYKVCASLGLHLTVESYELLHDHAQFSEAA